MPLVLTPEGERLAKRTRPASIASLRERGVTAQAVVGALAASAGLCPPGAHVAAVGLVALFSLAAVDRRPAVVTDL